MYLAGVVNSTRFTSSFNLHLIMVVLVKVKFYTTQIDPGLIQEKR